MKHQFIQQLQTFKRNSVVQAFNLLFQTMKEMLYKEFAESKV